MGNAAVTPSPLPGLHRPPIRAGFGPDAGTYIVTKLTNRPRTSRATSAGTAAPA
jgi:hypothetical protein